MRSSDWSSDVCSSDLMAGEGFDNGFDRFGVDGATREAAVQIDHMQVLRARFREQYRLRGGIVAIDGSAVHVALRQADDLAALEVDGGKNDEAHFNIRSVRAKSRICCTPHVLTSLDTNGGKRSEEHTSELQSLMRIAYA